MPVSKEQVLATAALCRLDVSHVLPDAGENAEQRLTRMAAQLDAIVDYMDILNHADTENVAPLYSPMQHTAPPRTDEAHSRRTPEEVLANAPRRRQSFFVVPPVI